MSDSTPHAENRPDAATNSGAEVQDSQPSHDRAPDRDDDMPRMDETPAGDAAAGPAPDAATATAADSAAPNGSQARIVQLESDVAALKDQLLRALAETENVRRRAEREREDTAKYAIGRFAKELLAVADNLRRAVESVSDEARQQNDQVNNLLIGVEATERQLTAAFERGGIQKMEPLDQIFDPNYHQVVMELENTGKPPGTVVQVLQPGYTIQGRLLREAMVAVSKGGEAPKVDTSA